ncbi:MAG: hypothetical protein PHD65_12840 [Gallionella sp.]|nr:hypothetical protein [Gallionella sp.]
MSEGNKQAWLVLSHAFNMDGRAASQTITDKIPHLINLGIEPIVISGLLGQKDKVVEHHQVLPAFPVALRFDLRHYLKQRIANPYLYRIAMTIVSILLLPFYLVEMLFIRLEAQWSWAITAYFAGARIIQARRPALIYSTGGAYSAHLAGYWLARRFELPWIAEIHDPMVPGSQPPRNMRERFALWLEEKICTHADIVWWFTKTALERAKARHPQLAERGHYVIPGADEPDFIRTPYRHQTHLVIAHFGSLSETRNLDVFLKALRKVIVHDPLRASLIQLHIYGSEIDVISARAIEEFPYPETIKHCGRLEADPNTGESGHTRVLKKMNSADCLLLLHGTEPFCEEYIPSKMYEYFWAQRPILAMVWHNPQMSSMLSELGHWAVAADNTDEVVLALEDIYARWAQDNLPDSNRPSPYTTYQAVQKIHTWTTRLLNTDTSHD